MEDTENGLDDTGAPAWDFSAFEAAKYVARHGMASIVGDGGRAIVVISVGGRPGESLQWDMSAPCRTWRQVRDVLGY